MKTVFKQATRVPYRVVEAGGAWFCAQGDDLESLQAAPMYDTEAEAQAAVDEMNSWS